MPYVCMYVCINRYKCMHKKIQVLCACTLYAHSRFRIPCLARASKLRGAIYSRAHDLLEHLQTRNTPRYRVAKLLHYVRKCVCAFACMYACMYVRMYVRLALAVGRRCYGQCKVCIIMQKNQVCVCIIHHAFMYVYCNVASCRVAPALSACMCAC